MSTRMKGISMRSRTGLSAVALLTSGVLALTACSSSSRSTESSSANANASTGAAASSTPASNGKDIKIGVITELTGVGSSGHTTTEQGVKAYVNYVNASGGVNGHKLTYVMEDTASSAPGALAATQKAWQQDKVFALMVLSSYWAGAEPYALKNDIPAVGNGESGVDWTNPKNTNLFSSNGVTALTSAYTAIGAYMKAQGVTSCGTVAYSDSDSSQKGGESAMKSCVAAGLKDGFTAGVPFGTTDVSSIALKMKAANVDGIYMPVVPNTGFALAGALRQIGLQPKAYLLATGYGGDLLASSAAVTAAQGFDFSSTGQPVEANTPATQLEAKNLASVGVSGTPTYAEQNAYISMAAIAAGLKAAGTNPTSASFATALRGIKDFDADGLLSPNKVDFSAYSPAQQCLWVVKLEGKKFQSLPNSPFCGGPVSG
jgi:branched-chain amino acid transport system substrate-binding protein